MSEEIALLDCTFGWGKTCRLYEDSIEIAGRSYNLDDLTSIHPTYRTVLGVSSARLELSFGQRHLTLRGIPNPEMARRMVGHLLSHCSTQIEPERHRARTIQARDLARAQARAWERTKKLPAIPPAPQETLPGSGPIPVSPRPAPHSQKLSLVESPLFEDEETSESLAVSASQKLAASELPAGPLTASEPEPSESTKPGGEKQECSGELAPSESANPVKDGQERRDESELPRPPHIPRLEPPLRSLQLVSPQRKKPDSCSLPAIPALKPDVLPVIHVPVRLQPGEYAHYSIGATLCSDRVSESEHVPYPPLDNGLLILTNRRIFYIGKRSQLVLPYIHLWYVSLLGAAIALHIERQFRRIIIEVEHAQEWASRIDQLALIVRRASPGPARLPLSTAAQLALRPSAAGAPTGKRPAAQAPGALSPSQEARPRKIIEARTISLDEPAQKDEVPTIALNASDLHEQDEFKTSTLDTVDLNEQDEFKTSGLDTIDLNEQDEFKTSTLDISEGRERDEFKTEYLETEEMQEPGHLRAAALEAQDTQDFQEMPTIMLNPEVSYECDEVETVHLQEQSQDDDQTISLSDWRKTHPRTIPRRAQVSRKLSHLDKADEGTIRPRRMPRGRFRK